MVLYFTGTGNSRYLARRIAEGLDMPLYDLNTCIKAGDTAPVQTGQDVVLVTPTYAWRIPRVVSQWLGNTELTGAERIWFVMDCGSEIGNAAKYNPGKTVLLKSLIGLHSIDKGKIFYNDRDITVMNNKQIKEIRKELGVVFQGGALFDSLSVLENVKFPLNLFSSMTEKEKTERAIFCLNRVNLNNVENLYPAEISGGMKKRVAIARAIVLQPKYLFCDEPNSGLDPLTSIVIDNLLSELTHEYDMSRNLA